MNRAMLVCVAAMLFTGIGAAAISGQVPPPGRRAAVGNGGSAGMLPERFLQCDLSHPLNLDPTREQERAEIQYEGHHRFSLFLPAIPIRTAPPPDPVDPPEPVDPHTKILFDPDRLTRDVPDQFNRVVDYWPKRVELSTDLPHGLYHIIIISDIDPVQGTAMLFMTHAMDAATLDLKHVFSGPCQIKYHAG